MVCGCSRVKLEDDWEKYVDLKYNHSDTGVVIVFCLNTFFVQKVSRTLLTKIAYRFRIAYCAIHRQEQACSKSIQKLPDTGMKVIKADILFDIQPSALKLTRAFFSPAPA